MKPLHLFSALALGALALLFAVKGYEGFMITVFILSLSTALCYYFMAKNGRPISDRTGYWHFGLIVAGLLLTLNLWRLANLVMADGAPDTASLAFDRSALVVPFIGLMCLVAGLFVFVRGLMLAGKKSA